MLDDMMDCNVEWYDDDGLRCQMVRWIAMKVAGCDVGRMMDCDVEWYDGFRC